MTPAQSAAALAALIALSACSPMEAAVAQTPAAVVAPAANADVTTFKIGALDAAMLRAGDIVAPNDGKTIGIGRPSSDVAAVLQAAGLPTDVLNLSLQALLVRGEGKVLLFDTGAGAATFVKGGRLPGSLTAAGVTPDQVTDIFISHSHADHAGGLVGADGKLAFPNAAIHMSAAEWAAMQADKGLALTVAAVTPKVVTFQPGAAILPNLVSSVVVNGHTPGHSAYEIRSGAEKLTYIGDTAHHFVVSVRQPDWTIAFDRDAPTAQASRRAFLKMAAEQNLKLAAPHFPFPGVGRVRVEGDGFAWVPE